MPTIGKPSQAKGIKRRELTSIKMTATKRGGKESREKRSKGVSRETVRDDLFEETYPQNS